jgi:hypothetical protein
MIAGSEKMNFALPPRRQRRAAGWRYRYAERRGRVAIVGQESLLLVRNPSWDPRSDQLRKAYPDRIELEMRGTPNSERSRNARKIDQGRLTSFSTTTQRPVRSPATNGRLACAGACT